MFLNSNKKEYKLFRLWNIFDIKKWKRLTAEDQTEWNTIYIGAIDTNNWVSNYIWQLPIHKWNTISLSYNWSVWEAFYQPEPYWATDDVNALYFKQTNNHNFNEYIALFLCTVIRKEKYRYSYWRKRTLEKMNDSEISLPVDKNWEPDREFMENYIKTLHYKQITTRNKPWKYRLNVSTWEEFYLWDIFQITNCISNDLWNLEEGTVAFIGRTAENNWLQWFVDVPEHHINKWNCITLSRVASNVALRQNKEFTTSQHITALRNKNMNIYSWLFICTVMNKYMEGRFSYWRTIWEKDIDAFSIKLPVDKNWEPDREFMENYIKNLPYWDRI